MGRHGQVAGHTALRRAITIALSSLLTVALGVGYLAADLTDRLPGMLTLRRAQIHRIASPAKSRESHPLVGDASDRSIDAAKARAIIDDFAKASGVGTDFSIAIAPASGDAVAERNASTPREPASTTKTLTAFAAALTLDMGGSIDTEAYVSQEGDATVVTLKGNGDMLLGEGKNDPGHVDGRAGLGTLADDTARALGKDGVKTVELRYDDSLFGSRDRYPANIVDNNGEHRFYTAISSMAVDGGRQWSDELPKPDDPDDAYLYPVLSETPAKDAATVFADRLRESGIDIKGDVRSGKAPEHTRPVARVRSASLGEQLAFMLRHSDNTLAELFGRLTALKLGYDNSIGGDLKAVEHVLREQGIPIEGLKLTSCSGLAPGTTIAVPTLIAAQQHLLAAGSAGAAAIEGLSVPGLTGTARNRVVDAGTKGLMRVKTGSLTGVTSMTGNVSRISGGTLTFAVIVNNAPNTWEAAKAIDEFMAALAKL